MMQVADTIVVRLTPEGRGAVAVLLVAGPQAVEIVGRLFAGHGNKPLSERTLGRILHGRWRTSDGEEIVVCRRAKNEVEVHCHGGKAAAAQITAELVAVGCAEIGWPAWIERREANSIRAAARKLLAEARTERTARILLDQYGGALENALQRIARHLLDGQAAEAAEQLQCLLNRAPLGLHLAAPWKVAIAGPPNVGKSSLLNALVGFERSIVFDQPGTTRDLVSIATAIDGWPIELIDTAGLRTGAEELEAAGIERAERQMRAADLVIWVREVGQGETGPEPPENVVRVLNKIDLVNARLAVCAECDDQSLAAPLLTSAITGQGITGLAAAIVRRLIGEPPAPGDAVPFSKEQERGIRAAHEAVERYDFRAAIAAIETIV